MAKPKLRELLDKRQGRDRAREHKLEVQKKSQKAAEQKRKSKSVEEVKGAVDDAALEAGVAAILAGGTFDGADDEEGWEDASEEEDSDDESDDEEMEAEYDLNRLDESESDSDDDLEEDADDAEPTAKAPKSILKQSSRIIPITDPENTSDGSDIPLSDIEDDGSDMDDVIPHQRLTINNTPALLSALSSIALPSDLPFSEHMALTTPAPISIPDINDDLARELAFYSQSLTAAQTARSLLLKEQISFTRPSDYFAEMVKSDEHMSKIKGKMLEDAAAKKASSDARKQRDLKKFGKQVQQEKLKERAQEKRTMMDKVKSLKRKRQGEGLGESQGEADLFDVALEDAATTEKRDKQERRDRGAAKGGRGGRGGRGGGDRGGRGDRDGGDRNAKRVKKDDKFGFGGKKRFSKSNDASTAGDMSGYSAKKMREGKSSGARGGGRGGGRGGSRGSSRPGRARRAGAGR